MTQGSDAATTLRATTAGTAFAEPKITRPIRSNVTAQGQALNRRAEVRATRPDVCRDVA